MMHFLAAAVALAMLTLTATHVGALLTSSPSEPPGVTTPYNAHSHGVRMTPRPRVKLAGSCLYLRCSDNEDCQCDDASFCDCSSTECQCR